MRKYDLTSLLAIGGGLLAGGCATALLISDVSQTGWTTDKAIMPAFVILSVLAFHLAWQHVAAWRPISGVVLLVLSLVGSSYVIYNAMARRAEVRDNKVAQATALVTNRQRIEGELQTALTLAAMADTDAAKECGTGEGIKCRGRRSTLANKKADVERLQHELDIRPAVVADPVVDRIATIVSALGGDADKARTTVATVDPILAPVILEAFAMALFCVGFHSRQGDNAISELPNKINEAPVALSPLSPETDNAISENPNKINGGAVALSRRRPALTLVPTSVDGPVSGLSTVLEAIDNAGGSLRVLNKELSKLVLKSEASATRWRTQWVSSGSLMCTYEDGYFVLRRPPERVTVDL